ncbi:MAG: polysaccharide biosynthesis protein [Flavobacteriales bacterium]|nr:polysaccharide biosynthesis protein [Flavobacteriales bacterium]MCB9195759.1 polysaccharide biosynthesis protein [Flavobacteriales bacterium]MCB9198813.1 polysaccharide biosynthesis protein [Flavobacteriales bacterium]
MSALKKLAGQTAIYGASSILARLLNFLLTPFYVKVFSPDQFGIITELYAYVAFLIVFLTFGMETAFFRYATKEGVNKEDAYRNSLYSVTMVAGGFVLIAILFSQTIANWLVYPDHSEYVIWFALIVGLDALASIPLARLRKEEKAKQFAMINIANVAINIGLNLYFLWYCKGNLAAGNTNWLIDLTYNPSIGVGYVFISNLVASTAKFLMLGAQLKYKGNFDWGLWKEMFKYAYPMLFVGLAFIINEMLDRMMLKPILTDTYRADGMTFQMANEEAQTQLGIYGGNYKIAMIISMFLQAYRYAAEPFFFNQEKEKNSKTTYSRIMNYFVIIVSLMFLVISMNLQIVKHFTPNSIYWEGLRVVPILLGANVLLGIYTNQSIWYKLSHKTQYGALISIVGAIITISINFIFIPISGYIAAAWATFICYGTMVLISYFMGQRFYPIKYNLRKIGLYVFLAFGLYLIRWPLKTYEGFNILQFLYNNALIVGYLAIILFLDKSLWEMISTKILKRK